MKKLFIVLLMAVVVLLPSCESEEEKALRETREACVDIIETVADVLENKGVGISDKEYAELNALVDEFKENVKNETTIDGIKDLAEDALDPLMFYAMFTLDENTYEEVYNELETKYSGILGA